MKIEVGDTASIVIVTHKEERVIFDISLFKSTKFRTLTDPFYVLNSWFANQDPRLQLAIFDIYKEARIAMAELRDIEYLGEVLAGMIGVLYRHIQFEPFMQYIRSNNLVGMPFGEFKERHDPEDKLPQRTYLVSDYLDLATLSIALRAVLPIWAEFAVMIQGIVGSDYKEQIAVARLLPETWIPDSRPVSRLRTYVEALIANKIVSGPIYDAMSSDEFPDWFVSLILVRKVCIGDVSIDRGKGHIVAEIYTFIDTTMRGLETRFSRVGIKSGARDDGEERSVLDDSRVRQNTTIGYKVGLAEYLNNVHGVCVALDPTIPIMLITGGLEKTPDFPPDTISSFHTVITQLVISLVIPCRQLQGLEKSSRLKAMNAVRIVLWHWGHKELSLLMSSPMSPIKIGDPIDGVTGQHRSRVDQTLMEELERLYPYRLSKGKNGKSENPVYTSTVNIVSNIPSKIWYATPIGGVKTSLVDVSGAYPTPDAIHIHVINLMIDLASRRTKMVLELNNV